MALNPNIATGPTLQGSRVRLSSVRPSDYEWIYRLAASEGVSHRWRFGGLLPSPPLFESVFWQNCDLAFAIRRLDTDEPIGVVQLINLNNRHGHAGISLMLDESTSHLGWPLQAAVLFVEYVFAVLPLRKLYFESPAPVFADYASALGELLVEEGRLRKHEYYLGEYVDLVLAALYRETLESNSDLSARLRGD